MEVKCPECKNNKFVVRCGTRHNKYGDKQKYRCNECWNWFVEHDAFWKKKYSKEFITEAMSCYKRGMSFQETSNHMNEYRGTKIVPSTVFFWVRDFSKILKKMDG